jgi:hypothetical protein
MINMLKLYFSAVFQAMNLFKKGVEDLIFFLFKKPTDQVIIKYTIRNTCTGNLTKVEAFIATKL